MNGQLLDFITNLKIKAEHFRKYDEIETKQGMILPILQLLGWNVWDTEEVKPEHPVEGKKAAEGGKVDYCIRINRKNEIFLEVKRPSEDLERHQEQLLDYSFREGIDIAVLSNGIVWWFYIPIKKGHWKERKFYAIDIAQQSPNDIEDKFIQLLSKENVQSSEALKNAEFIYSEQDRKKKINETLPKSWNKVVGGHDLILINLLAETTEGICGFRPEVEDVKDMIIKYKEKLILPEKLITGPEPIKYINGCNLNTKSPYGHRINSQAGQIDEIWHQLKEKLGRGPTAEEVNEASNKTLTISRVAAHLKYWKKRGRYATDEPKAATWDNKEKMDILGDFITAHCLVIPEACSTAKGLYQAYIDWSLKAGKKMHLSKQAFGICLRERGFHRMRGTAGIRLWRGIRLAN